MLFYVRPLNVMGFRGKFGVKKKFIINNNELVQISLPHNKITSSLEGTKKHVMDKILCYVIVIP